MTDSSDNPNPNDNSAYLINRSGGRWADMFRLMPAQTIVIGRSSQSQLVINSDGASRSHAKLWSENDGWFIKDLGSRNGTLVNGQTIAGSHGLNEGDAISIAGFEFTFARGLSNSFPGNPSGDPNASTTSQPADSNTLEQIDPTVITERRRSSRWLDGKPVGQSESTQPQTGETRGLVRAMYQLAQATTPDQAAETALGALAEVTGAASGAVLVKAKTRGGTAPASILAGMTALATRSRPGRSYRRVPERIAATVFETGEALLARNIAEDLAMASPDSRGQLSTTSTLCAPITVAGKIAGILHLYSSDDEPELAGDQLEAALAIATHLGVGLEHLWREKQLHNNLQRSQQQLAFLREQLRDKVRMIGGSEPMLKIEQQVSRAAPTNATVLIRGESGVGKELIAAAIHHASPRHDGPFVCLNCAALSPSLLESELFGHEKGAFTGATERKLGKFEAADGGTLMLDEIGEMSPEIQAKFLRVLEGQAFERVGGNTAIRADVRVVAATNRNLEQAVREGSFRSDLFFRLHVLQLLIPPLRDRGNDIIILAEHFLAKFATEMGRRFDGFTESAKGKLLAYRWPGNVRELKNTIERAVVLGSGPLVDADDLMLSDLQLPGSDRNDEGSSRDHPSDTSLLLSLAELEERHIDLVLQHTGGNKSQAAKILGVERSTLDRKLKRASK